MSINALIPLPNTVPDVKDPGIPEIAVKVPLTPNDG